MRKLIVFFVFGLFACQGSKRKSYQDLFEGIYTRYSEHEFGREFDTIIIFKMDPEFKITRKWKYERVLDGVSIGPEYKQKTTTGFYDEKYRILHENETGNRISIDDKLGILFIGATKYRRL